MPPLLVAAVVVALATALGIARRLLAGRARRGSGVRITARDVDLTADAFGASATLLQFSTDSCARSPDARRLLAGIADDRPGVRHVEVDLTHRADLASRFGVLATPTTLVLDGRGRLQVRMVGTPRAATVVAALDQLARPEEGAA